MASAAPSTGKLTGISRAYTRQNAEEIFARALGQSMRRERKTNEMLERESGIEERRIETFRSFTESGPIYLEDFLELASVLGAPFVTAVLSSLNMYAADYNGISHERIAKDAIELLRLIAGNAA